MGRAIQQIIKPKKSLIYSSRNKLLTNNEIRGKITPGRV